MSTLKYSALPAPDRYAGDETIGEIRIRASDDAPLPIVFENKYIVLLNDPVRFPDDSEGHYLRLIERPDLDGRPGVVMLPRFGAQFVLLEIFRHATRAWELEIPRGFGESRLTTEENVYQEIFDELGVKVSSLEPLGEVCPDTGILSSRVKAFLVELEMLPKTGGPQRRSEAIRDYRFLKKDELLDLIKNGKIRDSFTLSTVLLAIVSGRI